jgi:hypothetical protein
MLHVPLVGGVGVLDAAPAGADSPVALASDVGSGAGLQGTMVSMNLISWNTRGVGKTAKLISSTYAKVIFVSETLSSRFTSHDLANHFPIHDRFVVRTKTRVGGLSSCGLIRCSCL